MPDFQPGPWNQPDSQPFSNCYDYATNNRTEWHPPMPIPPPPGFAVPGRTKGVTCMHPRIVPPPPGVMLFETTCQGIKTGALLDGLKEVPANGQCGTDCWLVAYFMRPAQDAPPRMGDYHFARRDNDGRWSHKIGKGPAERLPDAPPPMLPGPEVPGIVPGYQFCGYLCCCPDTQVAMRPRDDDAGSEVAMLSVFEGQSGVPMLVADASGALDAGLAAAVAALGTSWQDGIGPGTVLYEYDRATQPGAGRAGFLIADVSVTEMAGRKARHRLDQEGRVARHVRGLLGAARAG